MMARRKMLAICGGFSSRDWLAIWTESSGAMCMAARRDILSDDMIEQISAACGVPCHVSEYAKRSKRRLHIADGAARFDRMREFLTANGYDIQDVRCFRRLVN